MLNDSLQVGDKPLCTTPSEKRLSSFILLLKQVLRLLCLAQGVVVYALHQDTLLE